MRRGRQLPSSQASFLLGPAHMQIAAPLNSEPVPILQWIEISSSLQIPSFQIIGLPNPEVSEARERVRAAIEAAGFAFPRRRLVLNLSPASVRKRGTGIDLAMALAVLDTGSDEGPSRPAAVAWGELGLDGSVKPVGQLTRAIYSAWKSGIRRFLLSACEQEAALRSLGWIAAAGELSGQPPRLIPVGNLKEAWEKLGADEEPEPGSTQLPALVPGVRSSAQPELLALPRSLERAVGVSASGQHHLLLIGPRGSGKSHALEWRSAIEPAADASLTLRHLLFSELAPTLSSGTLEPDRPSPVRRVSSFVRPAALFGQITAQALRPGDFTLADGGLLLADELPEWSRDSREALREPLERGRITISRVNGSVELPASFTLVATANFCPCGGWPPGMAIPEQFARRSPHARAGCRCECSQAVRQAYFSRLSGPVRDRIDLIALALPGPARGRRPGVARIREQVQATRETLRRNWGKLPGRLEPLELERILDEHPEWSAWIEDLRPASMRSRHKMLRLALSLAAWDGREQPGAASFIEAHSYRAEGLGLGDD